MPLHRPVTAPSLPDLALPHRRPSPWAALDSLPGTLLLAAVLACSAVWAGGRLGDATLGADARCAAPAVGSAAGSEVGSEVGGEDAPLSDAGDPCAGRQPVR